MEMKPKRTGRWIPLVYYYLATVVGLSIFLIGVISGFHGLILAALPKASPEVRYAVQESFGTEGKEAAKPSKQELARRRAEAIESVRLGGYLQALRGAVTALVGGPVFIWHLRQARRREPEWLGEPAPAGG